MMPITLSKFNPNKIPGCACWLEADRGITLDGSNNVSAWADQSGNGRHASEATYRPSYVTDVINGYPVIRWSGTDHRLDWVDWGEGTTHWDAIFVLKQTGTDGYKTVCQMPFAHYFYMNAQKPRLYSFYTTEWPSALSDVAIIRIRLNSSGSSGISVNGSAFVEKSGETPSNILNWTFIGRVGTSAFRGDLAAIVIYPRYLADSEARRIEQHYSGKYNIALAA